MQDIHGLYMRKSDGKTFNYNASFSVHEWVAKVSLLDGGYSTMIRQAVVGSPAAASMENHVRAWVESCIEDRVGID